MIAALLLCLRDVSELGRSSWRRLWVSRWFLAAGLAWIVMGCSTGAPSGTDPEVAAATAAGAEVSLPLDAYVPTAEAAERGARARDLLLSDCLGRFGLRWKGLGAAELRYDRLMAKGWRAGRFGLVDEGQARQYGYHPPPWSPQHPDARRQQEHHDRAVSGDVRAVLFGTVGAFGGKAVPRGGCVQEADRALSSGVRWDGDPMLVSTLEQEADAQADADPRKQDLFRRWSSCMRRAGFAYGVPRDAVHDRHWWPDFDGRPGADELKVAIADVRCKREVRYLETAATVTAAYQRKLIGAHADALRRLRQFNDIRARRVEQVLERGVAP